MLTCTKTYITTPATLYRVADSNNEGLWYDKQAIYTGKIKQLYNAVSRSLPMGYHPVFAYTLISATKTLEELKLWFSKQDYVELEAKGYKVIEIQAPQHVVLDFGIYKHEAFDKQLCTHKILQTPLYT